MVFNLINVNALSMIRIQQSLREVLICNVLCFLVKFNELGLLLLQTGSL
jgi:hypothetical protein